MTITNNIIELHTANTVYKLEVDNLLLKFLIRLDKFLYNQGMRGSFKDALIKENYNFLTKYD